MHGPYILPETADQVVVTWETELPGDSWVDYGLTDRYGLRTGSETPVQSHRVELSKLRQGRRYFYQVSSAGSRREGTFTAGIQFVKGPYSQNVTPSGIVLMWETEPAAEAKVAYGPTGALADTVTSEGPQGVHEVRLTGLQPGTGYRYRAFAEGLSSAEAGFTTPAPADTAFSFLLYGDSRNNPEVHGALVAQMEQHLFDFVLHSGDFVYDGLEEDLWGPEFFDPVRALALRAPIFPALGNHEHDCPAYYRFFSVPSNESTTRPEAWYAFDYGNAHFVVLDTNQPSGRFAAGTEQLRWLEQDLESSKAEWTFAVFHHPLYSSGRHKSDLALRKVLMPIFERHGVDMVLTGHDHLYERTWPLLRGKRHEDGIIHVVSGGGGATLYGAGRSAWTAVSQSAYHYCLVQVSGSRLNLEVYDIEGNQIDLLTVHKDRTALDRMLEAVNGDDPVLRLQAVEALGRTGQLNAVHPIAALSGAEEIDVRRAVAEALTRIGSPKGLDSLLPLSDDEDVDVRRWALRGLINLGESRVARICMKRLVDPDREVRRTAAQGLQRTPLPESVPALVKAASQDEDARVRLEVVRALVLASGTVSAGALISALGDSDPDVRHAAFDGVKQRRLLSQSLPALIDLLDRENARMRRDIIHALGEARDRRALSTLTRSLKDEDAVARRAAAIALGKLMDTGSTEALINALDDPDRRVRTTAMRALGVITREVHGSNSRAWETVVATA